ncbi:hypothetical protein Tco_0890108 [Tanacetum coccineum]
MERGFLSQKGSGRGRGVKEKDLNRIKRNTTSGIGLSTESDETINEDTPVGVASAVKEGVTPYVVNKTVKMEKISSVEDTIVLGSFPPLSTPGTTKAGNALGKSSYANVTGKPSGKKLNFHTLFTPGENKVAYLVVANYVRNTWGKYGLVHSMFSSSTGLFSFQFGSIEGLDAMLKNGPWSSYARAMIKFRADVKLKDNIIMDMPKITRESHYTCNVCVEYEWKPPMSSTCKVFGHIHEECPKNTGADEKKTVKMPSQTSRGVLVGPNGFLNLKEKKKEYRPIPKKPTASSSSNKKKGVVPTIEVSKSNPFEVLNLVDNDVELGTNGGTTNLVNNEATSSGSSFMNVDNNSTRTTTHYLIKIRKFEELLTSEKATLVDEAGNPLKKVEYLDDYDSEDEVASIDNDMARSMASERVGFGTQSCENNRGIRYRNGYLRKKMNKQSQKRKNRTPEWKKTMKDKAKIEQKVNQVKKSTEKSPGSTSKINPVNPRGQKSKKYKFRD